MRPICLVVIILLTLPSAIPAQTINRLRTDTFADAGARSLVLSALELRDSAAAGLASYEATVIERSHVGMSITRRLPLRDRTLYHREQAARAYWTAEGSHRVRWLGRREAAPAVGAGWASDAPFGIDFDIVDELDLDDIGVDLLFDPFGDRLDMFDAEFVQPVSGEGLGIYLFASGDTMAIRLPSPDRTITLIEVSVEPRFESWETVEGSLWFDRDTGVLVRASYRPSGVWDHEVQEPGSLDDVPGFIKPGIGTVSAIVIEYGLYEQRWWLPRRVFGEGEFDWGHGLVRMPLTVEWTMSDHVLNAAPGSALVGGDSVVSLGIRIRGDDERRERIEYFAPPGLDLTRTPDVPPPLSGSPPIAFTRDELDRLVSRIDDIAGAAPAPPAPAWRDALLRSIRYDRVRGPSLGLGHVLDAGPVAVDPSARIDLAVPDVEISLGVRRGPLRLEGYRRIEDASDWNLADGLGNTAATLLFGHDGGDYYRAAGGSLTLAAGRSAIRASLSAFAEAQRPIERQTNVSLSTIGGGSLRPNLDADRIDAVGLRGAMSGQLGADVRTGVVNWRLEAEAAGGDVAWGRTMAGLRYTGSISDRLALAVDVSGGYAGHGAPVQREFLLGGAGSIRGVSENAIRGPAFWMVRTETGFGLAGLRAIGFLDLGWAGERDQLRHARPAAGVGAGVSFMDGLLRMDIARGLTRATAWRAYFHLDAML